MIENEIYSFVSFKIVHYLPTKEKDIYQNRGGKKKKKRFCYDLVDKDIHVVFQCLFLNSLQSMDITMFAGNL